MAKIILTEQKKAADPTRGHLWPTDESLILQFCLGFIANPGDTFPPVSIFFPLYSPPRIQVKRHCGPHPPWTQATPGARQAIKTGLLRCSPLFRVDWRFGAGNLALWQKWHHSVKWKVTGKAVIVRGMQGLSVCLLPAGRLTVPQPGFLELPSIVFTHRVQCPLKDTQTCPQPLAEKWIFLWFTSNWVAFELTVLWIKGILLFYKASWGMKNKCVPLVLFLLYIYLHILKSAQTHSLYTYIYLKWKGEANLSVYFTPQLTADSFERPRK